MLKNGSKMYSSKFCENHSVTIATIADSAKKDDVSKEIRLIRCLKKATETTIS